MSGREAHPTAGPVVAVIGASTPLGGAVAEGLALDERIADVIAVGPRRHAIPGVRWRICDESDPVLARKLQGVDVLVMAHIDRNIAADPTSASRRHRAITANLADAVLPTFAGYGLLVSSAMVYGALPDNPVPLADDAPCRATASSGVVADFLDAETRLLDSQAQGAARLGTLRSAMLVGADVDSVLTRHFEAPRLLVIADSRPLWQFVTVDDLIAAAATAIAHRLTGPLAAGSIGSLSQAEVEAHSGLRRWELPAGVVIGAAQRLHRVGAMQAPADELEYLRFPWVVAADGLRRAGWEPQHTNVDALRILLDHTRGRTALAGRRLGRPQAAQVGAAGAAAAVLGAAAVMRARRRRYP